MKDITAEKTINGYFARTELGRIFDLDVAQHCRLFQYERGELICENGADVEYLLFMVKGEAKVYTLLENGKSYLLRFEKPMIVYGDIEVLFDQVYSANVEAMNSCCCLGIPIGYIRRYCLDNPVFLKYVIGTLSARLDAISHMSTSNLLLPLKNKFASYLMAHKEPNNHNVVIQRSYVNLADQLGATYRHLSRVMSDMTDEGLIERNGKKFVLIDLETLSELAGNTYRY